MTKLNNKKFAGLLLARIIIIDWYSGIIVNFVNIVEAYSQIASDCGAAEGLIDQRQPKN